MSRRPRRNRQTVDTRGRHQGAAREDRRTNVLEGTAEVFATSSSGAWTSCIWSSPSPARACCRGCWNAREEVQSVGDLVAAILYPP